MSAHPTPTTQADEDAQYYRRTLHAFIDMGTDLATQLHHHASQASANGTPPTPDTIAAFERVGRTVRRTILLAQRVAEPPRPARPGIDREAARRRILRNVEDSIELNADDAEHADALRAELLDRLDGPDIEDDIAARPVPEIIQDLIRDLGLVSMPGFTPFKRRTPADIATLNTRAAKPRPIATIRDAGLERWSARAPCAP